MNDRSDQPRDPAQGPVEPQPGAEDPTVEQPRPDAAAEPAKPDETKAEETPAAETTAHAEQAPPAGPPPYGPPPGWGAPAGAHTPPPRGGFRRFVGHRATQLVGVGLLGLLIGGGVVGGIAAAAYHGPRDGRPGIHRYHDGPGSRDFRGPDFDHRGDGH